MAQSVSLFFEHFFFRGSTSQLRQFGVFSNDPGNPPEKRHGWKLPPDVVWRTSWGPKEKDDDTRHRAGEVSDSSRGHEKLPSLKLTWNLKMTPWKRRFLLETMIFRFHVKFRGCRLSTPTGHFTWRTKWTNIAAASWGFFVFVCVNPQVTKGRDSDQFFLPESRLVPPVVCG